MHLDRPKGAITFRAAQMQSNRDALVIRPILNVSREPVCF